MTMTQKPPIVKMIKMLAITIVILCFVEVSSFAFNPLKCISIKSQHNNLIGVRFFNTNHVKPTMIKLSPLKLSQSTDEQVKSSKAVPFLNIANILTISRVLAIPFFMLSFVMKKKSVGVLIYIMSCLTDFLDGFIARKFNLTSPFGAFLDPVADKLMVATALIMLVCQLPTWWFACPVALIMCREIGVSALREWMAERGQRNSVQVGSLGKIKTTTQMISTAMLLEACPGSSNFDIAVSLGISRPFLFTFGVILFYFATILTVVSGFQYLIVAWPILTENVVEDTKIEDIAVVIKPPPFEA